MLCFSVASPSTWGRVGDIDENHQLSSKKFGGFEDFV
jgi:hypothetical protein